jgi:hypothetical protein
MGYSSANYPQFQGKPVAKRRLFRSAGMDPVRECSLMRVLMRIAGITLLLIGLLGFPYSCVVCYELGGPPQDAITRSQNDKEGRVILVFGGAVVICGAFVWYLADRNRK